VERTPDFLCVSKGITGGFLPLALTITSDKIYQAFLSQSWDKAFAHGHSYTANPLACAAAVTSLGLLMSPHCQQAIQSISEVHTNGLNMLQQSMPILSRVRQYGTIAAFDLIEPASPQVRRNFLDQGLLIRPLGKTVYLLPPYCINKVDLTNAYEAMLQMIF